MSRASCSESSAAFELMLCRHIRPQRLHIHQRPGHVCPQIRIAERPDNRRESRNPQTLSRQVNLLHSLVRVELHIRQQWLQLAQLLCSRRCRLRPAQNHPQVVFQAPLNRIVQRQIERLTRRLAGGHASLKIPRSRPRALSRYLRRRQLLRKRRRNRYGPTISANAAQAQKYFGYFLQSSEDIDRL